MNTRCALCGGVMAHTGRIQAVVVRRCRACGHRVADHGAASPGVAADYHLQYDTGEFLEALRETRRRQARRIIHLVREALPTAGKLLDYGCGRGWFLEEARGAGFTAVAGLDTSRVAVDLLIQRGIEAALAPEDPREQSVAGLLSFRPEVLTLLDVVEHLPVENVVPVVRGLVESLSPDLQLVVLKVPVASGLLFRVATALARLGVAAPLGQLYQVGTEPPHRSYFTTASLRAAGDAGGLRPCRLELDPDFEPETLRARVRALSRMPGWMARGAGHVAAFAASRFGLGDAAILVARVR